MILNIFVFILFTSIGHSVAFFYNDTPFIEQIKINSYLRHYYNPLLNQTVDFLQLLSDDPQIDSKCKSSLKRWIKGIDQNEIWAWKFLESTGKWVNGKLTGQNLNFGSFDYCIKLVANADQNIDFDGKYCLVSIQTSESDEIRRSKSFQNFLHKLSERSIRLLEFNIGNSHGVCMPSTCDINEIGKVFNKHFKSFGFSLIPPRRCTTISEPEPMTNLQIVSLIVLSIFIVLCFLSYFVQTDFLSNFSISQNLRPIYTLNAEQNDEIDDSKLFLHAVRTLLVFSSIAGHTFLMLSVYFVQPFGTSKDFISNDFTRKLIGRLLIFANIMFFISGFFSMYAWYDLIKSGKVAYKFVYFFLGRFVKVAIISSIVILINFLLPHLSTGPYYSDLTNHLYENCKNNGWKDFAMISNQQSILDMCIIPNWYLSADFQIYLLNYFVIYYLVTKPKLGFIMAFLQMFIVSLLTLVYIHKNNIIASYNFLDLFFYEMWLVEDSYFHSFYHYNAYVMGMICAWLIKNQVKPPKFLQFRLVRLSISLLVCLPVHWLLDYLNRLEEMKTKQGDLLKFVWPVIERFIVVVPYFWFFYSILIGYSVALRKMISFKFMIPLSRMSFTFAICQMIFFFYSIGTARTIVQYDLMSIFSRILSAFAFIILVGHFIFIFFEAPLFSLAQTYSGYKKRSQITNDKKFK